MDFGDLSAWTLVPLQILFVDLLLGADNALVIALACRRLPPQEMRQAATIGVAGAVVIRIVLALIASALLSLPFVKLIGAAVLIVIALNLIGGDELEDPGYSARPGGNLWSAAAIILIADTTMSLDNVVALAAIAQGNILWLAAGVALSLPIIAYGGVMLATLLKRAPWLIEFGAALLGWIALQMATTDALFGGWLDVNAPALAAFAPALGAAFVYLYGRLIVRRPARPDAAELGVLVAEVPLPELVKGDLGAAAAEVPHPELVEGDPSRSATAVTNAPPTAYYDPGAEPEDRHEPPPAPATNEDRIAIIGVLLLAVVAGVMLMAVTWLDSLN
jgi:YjbE family integral membrane protein